ncbi:TetR/AcrR family transcriptional regulator [Marinobacter sp. SS21]|uniref:TetR/AcrR family transcriptional regulator n=1 Tax=Marinobacter sp. SS21 TaxID=2979460 RepID=UPI00232BF2C5|nr:TetR/AcrR family transcriptional regulator [Marinobacter sp. SS21]MDC0661484.1 TetR/AcrR family transcriptional regulator [Marinobacter sp. SS21]
MRPVSFNKQKALAEVTQLFWQQGYEGTSVQQILDCTGLSRSSLYATFGDKRALFLQALGHFARLSEAACLPLRSGGDPRQSVRQFFELVFFVLPEEQRRLGCLLVNTVLEQSGLDDELATFASAQLRKVEQALEHCFEQAVANGSLARDKDPRQLAAFFMTVVRGLRVVVREGQSEALLRDTIATALNTLD